MSSASTISPVRIDADRTAERRLGAWTTARSFRVRARRGSVVLDLRSPLIPDGDIEVSFDASHSTVTILVPAGSVIDQWDLAWTGRGKVKRTFLGRGNENGRLVRLTGQVDHGEVRLHSGGIAELSALRSREYLAEIRRA
jgi:hypothetical protein